MTMPAISLNTLAGVLVDRLVAESALLRVDVARGSCGEMLVDAGVAAKGGLEAGRRLAEICMGGLGTVTIAPYHANPVWPFHVTVRATDPVLACLASQYAGWRLADGEGRGAYVALGSGPARALACKEPLFETIGYRDVADRATLVIEGDRAPPSAVVEKVARDCGVSPDRLTILYAPTQSLAGGVQIVARVLEVALHKVHELEFPLADIVDGAATAPLPPPHPDFVTAMGRTNDAIIYGGQVHLFVDGTPEAARALAEALPSGTSRDHGRPFADIFKANKGDFYAVDPMLFSPAQVLVTARRTGETFRAGRLEPRLLDVSFG